MIKNFINWLLLCIEFKEILPWSFPKDFIEGMEKIVEAVETADFDFDKVKQVDSFLSHDRECSYCGEIYSTLMCPCTVERFKENNTHHILCNLDPRLPVDECRQCIGFYKEALEE